MRFHHLARSARASLRPLFADHPRSFLIDAVIEGHLGDAVADHPVRPTIAMLSHADVVVFGGNVAQEGASYLAGQLPPERAAVFTPEGWVDLLKETHGEALIGVDRFAFDDRTLDLNRLRALATDLPEGFRIRRVDLALARRIAMNPDLISPDHVAPFDSPSDFVARGIGFCVLVSDDIVAGASSYAICNAGIEVQANTHEAYRRRGLATAVSAALIAHVLGEGRAAHWDAANEASAALAERLGYVPAGGHTAWVRVPRHGPHQR